MVRVRFFGLTAKIVGKDEIAVLTAGSTVAEIVDRLILDHPALADLSLKFALNQEYVSPETPVAGMGDELAIFTAVSGG
jgi:molybdopterin converting factor small subunit